MENTVYGNNPFSVDDFGHVRFQGRVWLPEDEFFESLILVELYKS